MVFVTLLVVLAYGIPTYGITDPALIPTITLGCICALARQQMLLGKTTRSVQIVLWGLTLMVLWSIVVVAGLRTPIVFVIPTLCMFAAWLLGERSAVVVFAVFSVAIAGIAIAETFFGYLPPNNTRTVINMALVIIAASMLSLLISLYAFRSFKDKLAEILQLTQAQKAQLEELRLSEERFSALFRANPMPSSTIDKDGRHIAVNNAWVALFGIAAEDVTGKTAHEMGLWDQASQRDAVLEPLHRDGYVDGMPASLRTASGVRPFLLYIAPVEFDGMQRLVTTIVDQTDHLAAEAAQRAVTEELEIRVSQRTAELTQTVARLTAAQEELVQSEKLASLGAMVAGISHELNTPIGNTVTVSSTMHAQIIDFKKLVDAGQLRKADLVDFLGVLDEMSDVIERSTRRAAELVTSFKQVAVDRSSERRREFDVATLVQELVTALKPGMRHRGVDVTVDIPDGIQCDSFPGPVGQVITNLIQNALTHAFGDAASGTIAIEARPEGDLVVMRVQDNGKGMDEHTLKHAFDPFFTTRLGQGGSGLGLSVSHRIANTVLGGALVASSTPGQGSCFTFSFQRRLPKEL
ncbi:MAG: PAS domain S-box protein [Rhodoferax sp.]|nr:PAS domain S-box protein [Rhodoferax sp.]